MYCFYNYAKQDLISRLRAFHESKKNIFMLLMSRNRTVMATDLLALQSVVSSIIMKTLTFRNWAVRAASCCGPNRFTTMCLAFFRLHLIKATEFGWSATSLMSFVRWPIDLKLTLCSTAYITIFYKILFLPCLAMGSTPTTTRARVMCFLVIAWRLMCARPPLIMWSHTLHQVS